MKRVLFLLILFLSIRADAYWISIDNASYEIVYDTGTIMEKDIYNFHYIFMKSARELAARFNEKLPEKFDIVICGTPSSFSKITAREWDAAALFSGEKKIFVFQNPLYLNRRGILERVIRHEIIHALIFYGRKEHKKTNDLFWIEESFCEAISPSYSDEFVDSSNVRNAKTIDDLKRLISNGTRSMKRKERISAYNAAFLWGKHLVKTSGDERLFRILVSGDEKASFVNEFREFKKLYP